MNYSRWKIIVRLVSCCVLFVSLFAVSAGQMRSAGGSEKDGKMKRTDSDALARMALLNRFSFKTNAFEWLLTIPNVGVEFDLSSSKYQRMSIGLSAKYNWGTYHKYAPSSVFNMFDVRPEFRYYYRTKKTTRPIKPDKPDSRDTLSLRRYVADSIRFASEYAAYKEKNSKRSFSKWMKDEIFTAERRNPHPNRAQYIGVYADYGTFSFKFGPKGIQGQAIGLGASYGYGLPLYQYDKGAIDIEFGFSLGIQVAKYDVFSHNPDGYYYTKLATESKDCFRFTPFPVVSEIRVAFAWRSLSIKEKYLNLEENPIYRLDKAYSEQFENMRKELDCESIKSTLFNLDERNKSLYEKGDTSLRAKFVEQIDLFKTSYLANISNALYPFEKSNKELVEKKTEQFTKKMESLARKAIKDFDREFRGITGVAAEQNTAALDEPSAQTVEDDKTGAKVKKQKKVKKTQEADEAKQTDDVKKKDEAKEVKEAKKSKTEKSRKIKKKKSEDPEGLKSVEDNEN